MKVERFMAFIVCYLSGFATVLSTILVKKFRISLWLYVFNSLKICPRGYQAPCMQARGIITTTTTTTTTTKEKEITF
jgi:hypothetical protein